MDDYPLRIANLARTTVPTGTQIPPPSPAASLYRPEYEPAVPPPSSCPPHPGSPQAADQMNVRDMFALAAMDGLIAAAGTDIPPLTAGQYRPNPAGLRSLAILSYAIADVMLVARGMPSPSAG